MMVLGLLGLAQAGVLSTYGGGVIGSAANTGAAASSPLSAWHNPAAMDTPRIEESVEWLYGQHRFKHNGSALSVTDDANGLLLGAVINGYWARVPAVHIGIASYLPTAGPYAWSEEPEGWAKTDPSPQLLRYSDELNRMEVAVAMNAWVSPWLSIGVGLDASANVETITIAALDDISEPESARKAQEVGIEPTFFPYAGLLVTAGDPDEQQLRLGLIGRSARSMHDYGSSTVQIITLNAVYQHDYRRHQAPRMVTLGAAMDGLGPLEIRAESTWAEWSEIPGPYGESLGGAWRDTVDLGLGVQGAWPGFSVQAGHRITPSAARAVPKGTAHLDGTSRTWTIGLKRELAQTRQRLLHVVLGLHRTQIDGGLLPDPSGAEHRFGGTLRAARVGIEIGHKGQRKESLWSR
jgi:hypothetical protein